jgi:hypothetical protein
MAGVPVAGRGHLHCAKQKEILFMSGRADQQSQQDEESRGITRELTIHEPQARGDRMVRIGECSPLPKTWMFLSQVFAWSREILAESHEPVNPF